MRKDRILLSVLTFVFPFSLFAANFALDPSSTLSSLNTLISQYEARIKQLEAENSILRNEMVKAGIKIPLVEYTGAILILPTTPSGVQTGSAIQIPSTNSGKSIGDTITTNPSSPVGATSTASLAEIARVHGKDVAGFISQINIDWNAIKNHYKLPSLARIAGYEFVQTGANDHTFVDIIIGTGSSGVYDMKMLYQFEKTNYKRKLIGIFKYDPVTARYATTQGTNPFAGTVRTFVRDPYFSGAVISPPTTTSPSVPGGTQSGAIKTATGMTNPAGGVTLGDISKAYSEKKYLSTITLSNSYLEKNPATAEILNIRYRTFFIIGKYAESLAEVAKIEALGVLDRQTACNAQVIATYNKNTALVSKYAAVCKK